MRKSGKKLPSGKQPRAQKRGVYFSHEIALDSAAVIVAVTSTGMRERLLHWVWVSDPRVCIALALQSNEIVTFFRRNGDTEQFPSSSCTPNEALLNL
jgi:hypothetical protein